MAMYKVKKTFKGSPNGINVFDYKKGEEVELTGDLENIALEENLVVKPRKTAAEKAAEESADKQAEEEAAAKQAEEEAAAKQAEEEAAASKGGDAE